AVAGDSLTVIVQDLRSMAHRPAAAAQKEKPEANDLRLALKLCCALVTATTAAAVTAATSAAAAAVAAATSAAAAAVTAAAATATVLPRPSLIAREGAAIHLLAVQSGDRRLRFLLAIHLHEAESFGPSRVAVHDDLGRLYRPVRLEHLLQIAAADSVGQVAHVNLLAHLGLL